MSGHVCSIPKSVPTWSLSLSLSLSPTSSGIKVVSVVATNNNTLSNSRRSEDLFSCSYPWSRRTIMKAPAIFHLPSLEKFEENVDSRKHFISPRPKRLFFHVKEKLKLTSPAFFSRKNGALCVLYFFCWSATSVEYEMRHGMEYRNPTSFRSLLAAFFF